MGMGEKRQASLENKRGFFNIGSHPECDIVLDGEEVLPFHMLLDCQVEPYRLVPLSNSAIIWLNGAAVNEGDTAAVNPGDTIRLAQYSLILRPDGNGKLPELDIMDHLAQTGVIDAGYRAPAASLAPVYPQAASQAPALPGSPESAGRDEVIVASLAAESSSASVDVDQTAVYALTLVNGSSLVSTFNIRVDGVPDTWVNVSPQNVNLNEGARAEVLVSITPPRKSSSTSGMYPLHFIITSFNHAGRQAVLSASLEVKPYYDYAIGELTPARKAIAWHHSLGEVQLPVTNRGNNSAPFSFSARDEEEGCRFQFMGDDGLRQTARVDLPIPPGETRLVPVYISPLKRRLVSLRNQRYSYRVSVLQPQNSALSLFTLGAVDALPLIGWLGMLIILLSLSITTFLLFTPRILNFNGDENAVSVGGSTALHWSVPIFTHSLQLSGTDQALSSSQGSLIVYPAKTLNTYTLTASTWLWNMLGMKPVSSSFTVLAAPGQPRISTFTISNTKSTKSGSVLQGDLLLLRWSVENASKVKLTVNGVTEIFEDKAGFNGEKQILVTKDTLVYLEAFNALGSVSSSKFLRAGPPTINIRRFETSKKTIYTGDQITIYWDVEGSGMDDGGEVTISGFEGVLPNKGELTFFPSVSTEYVLTVRNRSQRETRILPIGVLKPSDPPPAPVINFFTAAPTSMIGPGLVELAWSVSGFYDKITITNGASVVASDLSAQGFRQVNVSVSGTYVLTATYQGKSAGSNLQITVNPALKKPTLAIVSIFPSASFQMGDTGTVTISLAKPAAGDPPPTGTVIISDGVASCSISLPKTSCEMVFQTAGLRTLVANYQGDSNYVTTEGTYNEALTVSGINATLNATLRNPAQTDNSKYEYGEKLDLAVSLNGVKATIKPSGRLQVKKFLCDLNKSNCVLATDQPAENVHTFASQENGIYTFAGLLTLDQLNKITQLVITYSEDPFYNQSSAILYVTVDPSTRSPVNISVSQQSSTPTGLIKKTNSGYTYQFSVTDQNLFGFYSAPKGTVIIQGLLSDGTSATCQADLKPNIDNRSSSGSCLLAVGKRGSWAVSAHYVPASTSAHQEQTVQAAAITQSSTVQVKINSNSPALIIGVPAQMKVDVLDGDDLVVSRGTLAYAYNGNTKNCSFTGSTGAGAYWLCDTIVPADMLNAPISFNFTPANDELPFLTVTPLARNDLVSAAGTAVSGLTTLNASILPPPYIPNVSYHFQVAVSHTTAGGQPPAAGTVTAKMVGATTSCDDSGVPIRLDTLVVGSDGMATADITFSSSNAGLKTCYRYDGSQTYQTSTWSQATLDIRLLTTAVDRFSQVGGAIFPASYGHSEGQQISFTTHVSEMDGKNLTVGSGLVELKMIGSAEDCALDSSHLGDISFPLGSNGEAGGTVTLAFPAPGHPLYKVCYRFTGTSILAASTWKTTSQFAQWSRATSVTFAAGSPTLTIGVPAQIQMSVLDSLGAAVSRGTLAYAYNGATKACTFSAVSGTWLCDTIVPADMLNAPISFNFTPLDSDINLYAASSLVRTDLVHIAGTTVSGLATLNAAILPPPYIPNVSYHFRVAVSHTSSGGLPPTVGTVTTKMVSASTSCDDTGVPVRLDTLVMGSDGLATGDITFSSSNAGLKTCYRYDGSQSYLASPWSQATLDIRLLSTTVDRFGPVGGATFPSPVGQPEGQLLNFVAHVSEMDGKNLVVNSGMVEIKMVGSTEDCALDSSHMGDISFPLGSNGEAGGTVTFSFPAPGHPLYKLCYRYSGTGGFSSSAWKTSSQFAQWSKVTGIVIDPGSPVLTIGVPAQMRVDVVDSRGSLIIRGTLTYTYNGTSKSCLFTGLYWLCDKIIPADTLDAPISFSFIPLDSDLSYYTANNLVRTDLVHIAGTAVGGLTTLNASIQPPPYIPNQSYHFQVAVSHATSGGLAPASGTVTVKMVDSATSCDASVVPIRMDTLTLSSSGLAAGDITFAVSNAGLKTCYRYDGSQVYQASTWGQTSLDIRLLSTAVDRFSQVGGVIFPPAIGIPDGTALSFTAHVSETDGKRQVVSSGTVDFKMVGTTENCADATSHIGSTSFTVGTNGEASGDIMFSFPTPGHPSYYLCYRYIGAGIFADSSWNYVASPIIAKARTTKIVGSVSAYPTTGFVARTAYTFTATVSDIDVGTQTTPGGTVSLVLTSMNDNSCSSGTVIFANATLNNGTINGQQFTFPNGVVDGTLHRVCYRYVSSTGHADSASMDSNTSAGAYVKNTAVFSVQPSAVQFFASDDGDVVGDISLTLDSIGPIDLTALTLKNSGGTVICAGSASTATSNVTCAITPASDVVYTAPASSSVAGKTVITWHMTATRAMSTSLTPSFAGDSRNFSASGSAFTVKAIYDLVWSGIGVNPGTVAAYVAGQTDANNPVSTDVYGLFAFSHFFNFDYTSLSLNPLVLPGPSGTLAGTPVCTVTNVGWMSGSNVASLDCTTSFTSVNTTTVKLQLQPTDPSLYSDTLLSTNNTINVKGNIIRPTQINDYTTVDIPKIATTCSSNNVKFTITGKVVGGVTDYNFKTYVINNMFVMMGCEKNDSTAFAWSRYNYTDNSSSSYSFDTNTGAFTANVIGNNKGCINTTNSNDAFDADKVRVGVYFGYNTPTRVDTSGQEGSVGDASFQNTSIITGTTPTNLFTQFFKVTPRIHKPDDSTVWRACPAGWDANFGTPPAQ